MAHLLDQPPVMLGRDSFPLFKRVSLETTSNCNRSCGFCPISYGRRDFPQVSMRDELFSSIIVQLSELGFDGVIQMFLLNEPLLDRKMLDRLREARAALPRVTIYLSTNGDAIDYRTKHDVHYSVDRLMPFYEAGATTININIYDEGEEQATRYKAIVAELLARGVGFTRHKYSKVSRGRKMVALTDMRLSRMKSSSIDSFHNRTIESRTGQIAKGRHCARTQRHIVILHDGRVPICCAVDPTDPQLAVMADLNHTSIWDAWQSEELFKYRYYTQQGRRWLPACDTCDHKIAYAHLVRQVDAPEDVRARWRADLKAYQAKRDGLLPVVAGGIA